MKKNIRPQISEIEFLERKLDMEKQFQRLKDAPLDEYLPRICHIAGQLRKQGIKF